MHEQIRAKLAGLVIFSSLKDDPAVRYLSDYFRHSDNEDSVSAAECYSGFVNTLLTDTGDFAEYLYRFILFSDNLFIRKYYAGCADALMDQLFYELDFLGELALSIPAADKAVEGLSFPEITVSNINFKEEFLKALPDSPKRGVGIFAKSSMLRVGADGELVPVMTTDKQTLESLVGYERERRRVIENTQVLISGGVASNVLLYGDAGTGKSSTVKAIVNKFAHEGLRLIELDRSQVSMIPDILKRVSTEPLKFIIFIDDLTLTPNSPELCTLKTVLEGGAGTDRSNSVIYVTSNHRHLVRESAADRSANDVNIQDNIQGVQGLSARFGLTVTFLVPDRELYLEIVKNLAAERGITADEHLLVGAEAFAIRRNGRSPRCAKQYIELVAAGIDPIK